MGRRSKGPFAAGLYHNWIAAWNMAAGTAKTLTSEEASSMKHSNTLSPGMPSSSASTPLRWSDTTTCPTWGLVWPAYPRPWRWPWHAQLICRCGQHVRWLSKYQLEQYPTQQALSQAWPTTMALAFQAALRHQKGGGR